MSLCLKKPVQSPIWLQKDKNQESILRKHSKTRRRQSAWNHGNGFSTFSIRKATSADGVSPTLVYKILHDDLHLKPYKYQEWHKLEEYDYEKRVKFAQWFLLRPNNAKYILICSDEAYFHLTLPLNKITWSKSVQFPPIGFLSHTSFKSP